MPELTNKKYKLQKFSLLIFLSKILLSVFDRFLQYQKPIFFNFIPPKLFSLNFLPNFIAKMTLWVPLQHSI